MQQTDKALSDFNAWWDRQPFRDQFEDMKQQMANVWVASRRELVIELPPQVTAEDVREAVPFDADGDYAQDAAHMVNGAISACGSFAKAAGVTVRG